MERRRKSKLVVSFGETLWDEFPTGHVLGGAPFNFAYRISSLGDQGVIVTRLGKDEPGERAFKIMMSLKMETRFVQRDGEHPTGRVEVALESPETPDFKIIAGAAYEFINPAASLVDLVTRADCLCFGTLAQRASRARRTLRQLLRVAARKLKFLDINLRKDCFAPAIIEESLDRADMLKMNLQEAHYLAELFEVSDPSLPAFCQEMAREWSLSHCIVTLGEHGVLVAAKDGPTIYEPGYRIQVVDACGAGDAFSAGFIHAHLRRQPLIECCRLGNALGAMVAAQRGATVPISRAEIESFLESPHERIAEPTLKEFQVKDSKRARSRLKASPKKRKAR